MNLFLLSFTMVLTFAITLTPKEPGSSSKFSHQILSRRRYKGPENEELCAPKIEAENNPQNDENDITAIGHPEIHDPYIFNPNLDDSDLDDDEPSDSESEIEPLNYSRERYRLIYDAGMDVISEYHELLKKDKQMLENLIFLGGTGNYIVRFRNQYQEVIANVERHEMHFMRWGSNIWKLLDGIARFLELENTLVMYERVKLLQEQMVGYMETLHGMIDGLEGGGE